MRSAVRSKVGYRTYLITAYSPLSAKSIFCYNCLKKGFQDCSQGVDRA